MKDECPNGHDLRGEEIPENSRQFYEEGATHYSRKVGVEIRGAYDGSLYWQCPDCAVRWHRFPEGHALRGRAEKYINDTEGNSLV